MLKLQTVVDIKKPQFTISAENRVLVLGSCFAQHLAEQLRYGVGEESLVEWGQRRLYSNPNGVVYNPLSVARVAQILHIGEQFAEDDLVEWQQMYHAMDFHGSFSRSTKLEALRAVNRESVQGVDRVVITLGTSFVYFREGRVVANCHRLPEREFERRRITLQESVDALERVAECYPEAKIVVTVSPIRHLRDGLVENSVSKSLLRVACDEFCNRDPQNRFYFPSYEIVMDELRDYRFTEADMCHPTLQTKDYVWERFSELLIDEDLQRSIFAGGRAAKAKAHRPIVKGSSNNFPILIFG